MDKEGQEGGVSSPTEKGRGEGEGIASEGAEDLEELSNGGDYGMEGDSDETGMDAFN